MQSHRSVRADRRTGFASPDALDHLIAIAGSPDTAKSAMRLPAYLFTSYEGPFFARRAGDIIRWQPHASASPSALSDRAPV